MAADAAYDRPGTSHALCESVVRDEHIVDDAGEVARTLFSARATARAAGITGVGIKTVLEEWAELGPSDVRRGDLVRLSLKGVG
ncbi:MAG: hypothetical protein KatS3mg082_2880 [Nitrospiraceae bacterium]|nr:MAG: hypothetical protein KatS3mg082_2880 [Nitrospiraceae bacterium]